MWEFTEKTAGGELRLIPVAGVPVSTLRNRIAGARVVLRNGRTCCAILANIDLCNSRATEHFLTLSLERDGNWFDLARYHDVDYTRRGAAGLSRFLELPVEEIFPINSDISHLCTGKSESSAAEILAEPRESLAEADLIELALD